MLLRYICTWTILQIFSVAALVEWGPIGWADKWSPQDDLVELGRPGAHITGLECVFTNGVIKQLAVSYRQSVTVFNSKVIRHGSQQKFKHSTTGYVHIEPHWRINSLGVALCPKNSHFRDHVCYIEMSIGIWEMSTYRQRNFIEKHKFTCGNADLRTRMQTWQGHQSASIRNFFSRKDIETYTLAALGMWHDLN